MGLFDSIFGSSTTKVENKTVLPEHIEQASKRSIEEADRLTSEPYQPYTGRRVADFKPDQQAAFGLTRATVGSQQPYIDSASQGALGSTGRFGPSLKARPVRAQPSYAGSGGYGALPGGEGAGGGPVPATMQSVDAGPAFGERASYDSVAGGPDFGRDVGFERVAGGDRFGEQAGLREVGPGDRFGEAASFREATADSFPGADLAGYMNPYTGAVTANTIREMERAGKRARNDIGAEAVAGSAFGGSRHAIQEDLQREGEARAIGDLSARMNEANFSNAQNQFQTDASRRLQAILSNQGADLTRQGMDRSQFEAAEGRALQAGALNQAGEFTRQGMDRSQLEAEERRIQDAARVNQGADIATQGMNQAQFNAERERALRAALSNQGADITTQGMDRSQFNNDMARALQAGLANQGTDLARQGIDVTREGMDQSLFNAQRERELRAMLSNQSAGLQAGTVNRSQFNAEQNRALQSAELMNMLGREQVGSGYRDAAALEAAGQNQQDLDQRALDVGYQDFLEQRQWPFEMLNTRLGALTGSPYSQVQQNEVPGPSPAGQIAGLAATVPSIVSLFK